MLLQGLDEFEDPLLIQENEDTSHLWFSFLAVHPSSSIKPMSTGGSPRVKITKMTTLPARVTTESNFGDDMVEMATLTAPGSGVHSPASTQVPPHASSFRENTGAENEAPAAERRSPTASWKGSSASGVSEIPLRPPNGKSESKMVVSVRSDGAAKRGHASSRIAIDYEDEEDDRPWREVLTEYFYAIRSTILQTQVYLKFSVNDARQRKGSFCLGVTSILLVVLLCGLLLTTLSHLQIVFLKLAESESGMMDLVVKPGGQFSVANSLNYSVFEELLPSGAGSYHAPRVVLPAMMAMAWNSPCSALAMNASALWYPSQDATAGSALRGCTAGDRSCVLAHCSSAANVPSTLVFMDANREARMGLGSGSWPYRPTRGEVYISKGVADPLGLAVGDRMLLLGDVSYPFMEAFNHAELDDLGVAGSTKLPYSSFGVVLYSVVVAGLISDSEDKFESDITNFIIGNFSDAVPMTAAALSPSVSASSVDLFRSVPSASCASRVYVNLPPSRRSAVYNQRDYDAIQTDLIAFAALVFAQIGFNQVAIDTPILTYLFGVRFFSLFLGLIVSLILIALAFLSIVLIYSLLTVNIETRTFEMGLQRMIGFTKQNLTGLVLTNALLFAIPAWAIGLALSQAAYLGLRSIMSSMLKVTLPVTLAPMAVGFATLAGIAIPLLSSIAPVLHVLTLSLPDTLNTDRGRGDAVIYKITGRKTGYLDTTMMLLGTAFTLYGFLIYYLFPIAIINFNISLLFYIFFAILVAMLAGLVILSVNFERVVETFVTAVFFFWEQKAVYTLISKALVAHRPRNRTTTMMYALSLGFIIFITVAFNIQLRSIEYSSLMTLGGDARYRGSMQWEEFLVFDAMLQDERSSISSLVSSVTYISDDLKDQGSLTNTSMATIGMYVDHKAPISVIPPNFYDNVDSSFLTVGGAAPSPLSISEYLYTAEGSAGVIMSTSDKESFNLQGPDDAFLLIPTIVGNDTNAVTVSFAQLEANAAYKRKVVVAPRVWLDASPVVRMSSLPSARGLNVLMAPPSALGKFSPAFRSIRDIQMDSFVMKVSEANLGIVALELGKVRASMGTDVSMRDIYTTRDTLSTAVTIVNLFFVFTQVMAMVICFFSLLSSMSTNVLQQSKEIGVLRCIGMTKFPIYRLFCWEAFVLVTSASLLGMIVGIVVAYSMMLQNALFTQIPLTFVFPVTQLVVVLIASFVFSFLASYGPIAYLLNLPSITHILRRVL